VHREKLDSDMAQDALSQPHQESGTIFLPATGDRPDSGSLATPIGLDSVRLITTAADLADTAWGNHSQYDPGWVYHGLLAGTPGDAVRFLHKLMSGDVLPAELLTEMTICYPIGGRLPGRPWETTGYGLGLMIGQMISAGIAIGHSGAGSGSVSAVYHFGDRTSPCTIAAFSQGCDEGITEREVARPQAWVDWNWGHETKVL
jgi:D-alanyl-D-alanine carboxypeptidase